MMTSYSKIIAGGILVLLVGFVGVYLFMSKPSPAPEAPNPPPPVETPKPSRTVSYACDAGKTVIVAYYEKGDMPILTDQPPPPQGGQVELSLSGDMNVTNTTLTPRTILLPQTTPATEHEERYATADESFVFLHKGNRIQILEQTREADYTGCIATAPLTQGSTLVRVYASSTLGFSMRLPIFTISTSSASVDAYRIDESYVFKELGPGKGIPGVRFAIPSSMATGTNLSADSFISVEQMALGSTTASTTECSAESFLPHGAATSTLADGDMTHSVASSSDAAAGNRYEETVYAFPSTNPCLAVRYFIHYTAFENYPKDTIKQFNIVTLRGLFDQMRKTLMVSQ